MKTKKNASISNKDTCYKHKTHIYPYVKYIYIQSKL